MAEEITDNIIRYLSNEEIDTMKWDGCVLRSSQPLIYATSGYLDGMCKHWSALVLGDYSAVMPLPWNRKWMVCYVYSPYFVMAGGVFGSSLSEDIIRRFIKAIPSRFLYVDLDLCEHNNIPSMFSQMGIAFCKRRNTFLNLNCSYHEIFAGYSKLAKRKLKKSNGCQFVLDRMKPVSSIINYYKQYYKGQDSVIDRYDFSGMIALLSNRFAKQTKTYTLTFPDGEIAAFYLLLFDNNYVYWLLGGSTKGGKEAAAFYSITDNVIRDYAGTKRTFRFEGSDHDGIHFFNQQFGGETVYYPRLKINRLPWPFRYLK